jgi:hypothetical protein
MRADVNLSRVLNQCLIFTALRRPDCLVHLHWRRLNAKYGLIEYQANKYHHNEYHRCQESPVDFVHEAVV